MLQQHPIVACVNVSLTWLTIVLGFPCADQRRNTILGVSKTHMQLNSRHSPISNNVCLMKDCTVEKKITMKLILCILSVYLPPNAFLIPPVMLLRTPTVLFTTEPAIPETLPFI